MTPPRSLEKFTTGVSPAYWCSLNTGSAEFLPARMRLPGMDAPQEVAWLDRLLDGGIKMPDAGSPGRPLTMVITGPPGSGKTTLAAELCLRFRQRHRMKCLFVSTEQDTDRLIENATDLFGSREDFTRYHPLDPDEGPTVLVCGRDLIKPPLWRRALQRGPEVLPFVELAIAALHGWHFAVVHAPHQAEGTPIIDHIRESATGRKPGVGSADVLVIDGLNSVDHNAQAKVFARFLRATSERVRLLVFILDTSPEGVAHRPWEYACDLAIHLDYTVAKNYYVRTLQIVKARYQGHAWGVHQVKPYKPATPEVEDGGAPSDDERDAQRRRDHPYRSREKGGGGMLIYPSIHYYLSLYKRRGSTVEPDRSDTRPRELSEKLGGGLPEGRCTAFIGARGGHKSHLGYLHLLHRIVGNDESGIVISLRDDESMTRRTMRRILTNELGIPGMTEAIALRQLQQLEREDKLEVLYYHPGYITPEEFMHRLFVSLHRIKGPKLPGSKKKVTVLFNSLDQLGSRFPLCAKEAIFVPGMIEMLTGEDVTSIFISVDEAGQPPEQYGLLPMADLILAFNPHRFNGADYFEILRPEVAALKNSAKAVEWQKKLSGTFPEEIVLQVVRFSGGQRAGMRGILELAESDDSVYGRRGLNFVPISERYEFRKSSATSAHGRDSS